MIFTLVTLKKGERWLIKLDLEVYCFYSLIYFVYPLNYTFVYNIDSSGETRAHG